MPVVYDIHEILRRLPQKPPFLFLDRVIEHLPGKGLKAIKNVSIGEPYFQGHFPELKTMPGVLIGEALAQACALFGILESEPRGEGKRWLTSIRLKFVKPVTPGDQLVLEARVQRSFQGQIAYDVRATVDGETVAEGVIQAGSA